MTQSSANAPGALSLIIMLDPSASGNRDCNKPRQHDHVVNHFAAITIQVPHAMAKTKLDAAANVTG
ncbi:hypothetical protein, partial [Glaciihabitans sp. UYNi722]|uniref:hypothetical protein n=1 Tax=Glaciihabitans sp. UYNi722 TaxID=3156344 RepID=UPI0033989E5C